MKAITQKGLQKLQVQAAIKKINKIKEGAIVFLVLGAIVILGTIIFSTFPGVKKLQNTKKAILETDYNITELQKTKKEAKESLNEAEDKYESLYAKIKPKMDKILPESEDIYALTNYLEDYAIRYNSEESPLVLNNISFGKATSEGDYFVLPIRTNLQVSEINFLNFLTMINQSGSLKEDDFFRGQPIRLMTIESISVSLPQAKDSKKGTKSILTYPINLEINTYFSGTEEDKASVKPKKKK